MNDAPKLLVEWSSPWQEFVTALRPALARSPERLAGEARTGLFPYRGMMLTWVTEAALLVALVVLPAKLASMRPYTPPPLPKYDIIYFSGDELPQTEDVGGAQAGRSGRAGGREAHHRTQTIRVARGNSLTDKVVDAPKLNLPRSDSPVANLLAYKPIPGPAPAQGLKSSRPAANLPQVTAVPPPPEVARDQMRAAPAMSASVIPPAPTELQRSLAAMSAPVTRAVDVVPPPVSAPEREALVNPHLLLPAPGVVAPPAHVTRDIASLGGGGLADVHQQVIPPPPQMGGASFSRQAGAGLGHGSEVIPPPPSVGGGSSLTGRGRGASGAGFGGPLDTGSALAPPSGGGGNGGGNGIVVSSQPGSKFGVPGSGGAGSLAMSPSGGDKAGLGGSGGGTGIGRGTGPGSGFSGEGPGAGKEGTGHGSDPNARGGISPYPGPGGAGSGSGTASTLPGVSVRGGSTITLPSFGAGGNEPLAPGRSSAGADHHGPGITVIATSRSGGAFNFYGALKGDKVYTIYLQTSLGPAVLQFADPNSATQAYAEDLTAPEPLRAELPAGVPHSRLVLACILDRSGLLRNVQVLQSGASEMTAKVVSALSNWKFRPVLRGDQPVEVNAILGFNIDTR